uniref:Uncharacterized protein n=1 Tax=Myotis myotis TaxID=51298 RepID=A0A7J7XHS9_MYOMY|nr:hypothetical protein mMyoMyo1_011817 [Myotis myotis]
MGSYLSWARPRPPPSALPGRDPPGRPESQGAAPPGRCAPRAARVHSGAPALDLARKLSYEDLVASPRRRRHHRRAPVLHQRQYPARQARCLLLGLFASAPGGAAQTGLRPCSARMFCAAGILRMASAKGKLTFRLALKQTVICMWSSLSSHLAAPGAKEATALGPGCPLGAGEEKGPAALVDGGPRLAQQEERRRVPERQEPQRRGSDGDGGARSAFRRLMVNGVLYSFVPRPGPLRRDFCAKTPQHGSVKASQTSFLSSCSKRNAITSSYSSTRGLPASQRPPGPAARLPRVPAEKAGGERPPTRVPAEKAGGERPPTRVPAEKAGGESPWSSASVSAEPLPKVVQEKEAGVAVGQEQDSGCSPASDDGRPRRRRIPLLPRRRGDGRILPSPPQVGYPVTAEDLDLEKRARLQRIYKVLEG